MDSTLGSPGYSKDSAGRTGADVDMTADSDLYFRQIPVGEMANLSYLIGSRWLSRMAWESIPRPC